MATASREGVRRWDTATGRPIGELIIGRPATCASPVLYSPDGELLFASGINQPWQLVETATGRVRAALVDKATPEVIQARVSPDGTLLATSNRSALRFWDTRTGRDVGEPLPPDDAVADPQIGLSFHPKGRAIAAVSAMNGASVWGLPSRQPAFPTIRHDSSILAVEYSPDGSRPGIGVFSGGLPIGGLLVDADSGRRIAPLAHIGPALTMAFSPDGRLLLTGSQDRTVKFWDARDGKVAGPTLRLATDPRVVEIAPDGRSFLTVENWNAADPRARLWDLATHRPLGPPLGLPGPGRAYAAAFAPDSRSVVIGSFRPGEEEALEDAHDAVNWHLPPPVPDDANPERVALWAEVATG